MARLDEVIALLYEATKDRRLEWSALSENRFEAALAQNSVEVTRDIKGEYKLTLINPAGETIETKIERPQAPGSGITLPRPVIQLYKLARRRALRVDETLDDIAKFLKES